MPKLKTYKVTDATDAAKMTAGVNKVLTTLGLAQYVKCKIPSIEWLRANAADHKVDVLIEASLDPKAHQGPIKVTAVASNGTKSVMAVYTLQKAQYDATIKSLTACGLA